MTHRVVYVCVDFDCERDSPALDLLCLEFSLVDFVKRDFIGNRTAGETGESGGAPHMASGLFERPKEIALFKRSG